MLLSENVHTYIHTYIHSITMPLEEKFNNVKLAQDKSYKVILYVYFSVLFYMLNLLTYMKILGDIINF